jgi:hypothetical protein
LSCSLSCSISSGSEETRNRTRMKRHGEGGNERGYAGDLDGQLQASNAPGSGEPGYFLRQAACLPAPSSWRDRCPI